MKTQTAIELTIIALTVLVPYFYLDYKIRMTLFKEGRK